MDDRIIIVEAMSARGYDNDAINEAISAAEGLRAAGFNEETVEALYESYVGDSVEIPGEFTIEKLKMVVDPDGAWSEFWGKVNA